ncbi:MAG TPA: DASH family cryptochrome, partial [Marinobacter hydrocarbonoclasticus]|nr:DASH family cryptochrome [Marinobacter nauticus]
DNRGQCPPIPEPIHRSPFTGGEEAGLAQLQAFVFGQHRIADYKETRNALEDWDSSSKFSPW